MIIMPTALFGSLELDTGGIGDLSPVMWRASV